MIFLQGEGVAVDAIRATSWKDHPLGPPETWSRALRSALYTILNSAAPKVLLWGRDLIVFFNDAYLRMTAGDSARGIGMSYPDFRPELWDSVRAPIEAALAGEGSVTSEFHAVGPEQASWTGTYQLCFSPLLDEHRVISGVLIDILDLTARKAREDLLAGEVSLLNKLFSTTPVLISYCTGPELRIEYMNCAVRRLFEGRTLVGATLGEAVPEAAEQGHLERMREVLATGIPWEGNELPLYIRDRDADGAWHYFDFACHPVTVSDGSVAGVLFSGYDVTEHRLARQESEGLRHQLLHATRMEAMGTMAATIAHELNQPMTAAVNYLAAAEYAITTNEGRGDQQAAESLGSAREQMIRAGLIVRRMRSLVENGSAKAEKFELDRSIARAVDLLRAGGDLDDFQVEVNVDPAARLACGDDIQIEQVFVNIIRNSARASEESPCRKASIDAVRRASMIEVTIRDHGPGIAPAVLDRLFLFMQQSSPSGLGVGLSLSRTIIEAHGGTISASNHPSGGAVFTFNLPAAA